MARRSRAPVEFGVLSILERTQRIVSELQHQCRHSSLSSDRIHGYRLRLTRALRDVTASNLPTLLGNDTYLNIVGGMRVLLAEFQRVDSQSQDDSYSVAMERHDGQGRPSFSISREQLEFLISLHFTVPQIAVLLGVSPSTIARRLRTHGVSIRRSYTTMSDSSLDSIVESITSQVPNAGYRMVSSHLNVLGYRLQERRVRESLARVDPVSSAYRRSRNGSIQRRQYSVAYPNALWHIDSNMSLIRWGFVVHGSIDGYSRMITYLQCSTDNRAQTVLNLFVRAGEVYGFPSRTRSDYGGENIDVAHFMILLRGAVRGSHMTGRSVHNQRIERLWRDVFTECLSTFYHLFYYLESSNILCCDNPIHLYALQFVYIHRINAALNTFRDTWNWHSLRTAGSLSPVQLWVSGMLSNFHSEHSPIQETFSQSSSTTPVNLSSDDSSSEGSYEELQLQGVSHGALQNLQQNVDPLHQSSVWGIDLYVDALEMLNAD